VKIVDRNDPVLWQAASPVRDIAAEVMPHVDAIFALMTLGPVPAASIAGPQVGIPLRFFVTKYPEIRIAINPTITSVSPEMVSAPEGCMSWNRGINRTYVRRHVWVNLAWTDENGVERTKRFTGFEGRVVQHECDHLDGKNIFART
jgi:peptide deformylase